MSEGVFLSRRSFCHFCTVLNAGLTFLSFPKTESFYCRTATVLHSHTNTHVCDVHPTSQSFIFFTPLIGSNARGRIWCIMITTSTSTTVYVSGSCRFKQGPSHPFTLLTAFTDSSLYKWKVITCGAKMGNMGSCSDLASLGTLWKLSLQTTVHVH